MTLHTPMALLSALATYLPRLQAEETLRMASAVALGSGSLKKTDATALHDSLRKQAGTHRAPASAAKLQLLGFDVVQDGS